MAYNTQRDIFISELQKFAEADKNVILMSVDMGAPALDEWRAKLPDQFFAAGISEQNAINFASGLSLEGKKVYVYLMGSWAGRCWEQIRYSCAMARNPITFLGNGVGLGYAPAGPAHAPTEDIGYMRTINGIEIWSPANLNIIKPLVELTYRKSALRHIRLERTIAKQVADHYPADVTNWKNIEEGVRFLHSNAGVGPRVCFLSSGYMLGRAIDAANLLKGLNIHVVDLYRIKPLNGVVLGHFLQDYEYVVTLEEQTLDAGFGSAVAELICDRRIPVKLLRLGLPPRYIFENGSRDHLLDSNDLSSQDISDNVKNFVQ